MSFTASNMLAAASLCISLATACVAIPLSIRADRRSRSKDIPVVNVFWDKARFEGWARLTIEVDNQTDGAWTIDSISFRSDPNAKFAFGHWVTGLNDKWHPSDDAKTGVYEWDQQVASKKVETIHLYAQSTVMAEPGAPKTGWPLLFQPIIDRFSRRALRISLTKHSWSVRRHDLYAVISTHS